MNFLKNPLYNSVISGIIIYILIIVSNRGDPVLGAILSSLPIGLFGLIAIKRENNIQRFYIRSEIFTNLIIIIMWIVINILIYYTDNIKLIVLIAFLTWFSLSSCFYFISKKYLRS